MRRLTKAKKQQIAKRIGQDLTRVHGKRKYYSQKQIRRSLEKNNYAIDVHCWAYCLFMSHPVFDAYHKSIGETCDYTQMKESMLAAVTDQTSDSWFNFDFDLSWLELPDMELSDFFDSFADDDD